MFHTPSEKILDIICYIQVINSSGMPINVVMVSSTTVVHCQEALVNGYSEKHIDLC